MIGNSGLGQMLVTPPNHLRFQLFHYIQPPVPPGPLYRHFVPKLDSRYIIGAVLWTYYVDF